MTGPGSTLAIHESRADGWLRLTLSGELDLRSTPVLEDRLTRLRAVKSPVRLDLSKLEFIDTTGLHLLVRTVGDARIKRWRFVIEPKLAPQVRGLFKLVQLDHFLLDADPARD
jgi:anti-anti-sigma factor